MNQPAPPPPPPAGATALIDPAATSSSTAPRSTSYRSTGFGDTLRSEWVKVASLRSTWIMPVAAGALPVLVTVLVTSFADIYDIDLLGMMLALMYIPMVAINAFCATGVTSEYNHDTIRVTYAATPRRGRVVAAKYLVLVTYSVVALVAISAVSIGLGALILQLRDGPSVSAVTAWADLALALVVAGWMCVGSLAVGYLIRNSAAAVTMVAVYPFVAPIIAAILYATQFSGAAKWFPFTGAWEAAANGGGYESDSTLGRPWAFIYLAAFMGAVAVIAFLVERRRDV